MKVVRLGSRAEFGLHEGAVGVCRSPNGREIVETEPANKCIIFP